MTPRFSGSSVFTNILAILPVLLLTLNQFIWKTSVATMATLLLHCFRLEQSGGAEASTFQLQRRKYCSEWGYMGSQHLVSRVLTLWMLWKIFWLKILMCASVNGSVEMWRRPSAVVLAASSGVFRLFIRWRRVTSRQVVAKWRTCTEKIGVWRLRCFSIVGEDIICSRLGGLQKVIAAMWGRRHCGSCKRC
jgi:hypothetical protein